jgi:hypothetical protein
LVDSSSRGFVRQRGVGGKRERWPESKRGGAWVKLTDGGGGGRLGPDIDGGAPVGRLRHTVREVVEGGRASLRAGGFGREEKNLCSAVTDYLKGGRTRWYEMEGGPGSDNVWRRWGGGRQCAGAGGGWWCGARVGEGTWGPVRGEGNGRMGRPGGPLF